MSMVMIVDDEPDMVELIASMLKHLGHVVSTAYSGEEALTKLETEKPDLILLDIMMPGLDGIQVCGIIKRNPKTSKIPVVMVTARRDKDAYTRSMNTGANLFINKPFMPMDLLKPLKDFL